VGRDPLGLVGATIDGQYHLERQVGEGGFSVVYRGTHLGLDEPVAVKCLKLASALDASAAASFARRFRDEGRILYRLSQGCLDVVRCTNSGTTRSPTTGAMVPYIVLEWLEGQPFVVDLRERRKLGMQGRSLREAIELLEPAALALEHAHRQGVVHRDVKPANLFLAASRDGARRIKVLDFGLAKILDDTIGITRAATRGHLMMCSPRYAAPEQFDPKLGAIGPWTDVFSLGLVVLEVLRDLRVRQSDGMAACLIEATDAKARLRASELGIAVPPAVEAVLASAVALDVRARPPSAGAFWAALVHAAAHAPVEPEPPSPSSSDLSRTLIDPTMRLTREELEEVRRQHGRTLLMRRDAAPPSVPGVASRPGVQSPSMPSAAPMPSPRAMPSAVATPSPRAMPSAPAATQSGPHPAIAMAGAPTRSQAPSSPSSPGVPSSGNVGSPPSSASARAGGGAWWLVLAVVMTLGAVAAGFAAWRWHTRHGGWGALSSSPR
jgi:serine/threonine protein kinase